MLAPRILPRLYEEWNKYNGAPFGHNVIANKQVRRRLAADITTSMRGPFSLRGNNTTREFEYPWAFHVSQLSAGMNVVEIGGGVAGFQFMLSRVHCKVTNIDPGRGSQASRWNCNVSDMKELNRIFNTDVVLLNTTIKEANLADHSFDRAFAISVIEHLSETEAAIVMQHVFRILRPGGMFVITVDLFLDLSPFTDREHNRHGINQNIKSLCTGEAWEMIVGNPVQLYGYSTFNVEDIKAHLCDYLVGKRYPALTQCLVLRKP
jgi:SAM-dependent methyltransferase